MDTKIIKAKNNEAGTFGATISAAEVGSATVSPVPEHAPGVIVARPGTEFEEHIYYQSKDAGAGTISGLIRDYTNLNGGTGREHVNGAPWETLQSTEYINNIVDALLQGYVQEMQDVLYVSATTFTVETDQTSVYSAGRVVRFNQDNTKIGQVVSSSYSAGTGLTTVVTENVSVPNPITHVERDLLPRNATSDIVKLTATQTLSNKRNNKRVVSAASYTTDTGSALSIATCDVFLVTAQAGALKLNNPGGTPLDGNMLAVRIKDNGTARALTYDTQFRAIGTELPSTTVISKTLYMLFMYNSADTKWDLLAVNQEA